MSQTDGTPADPTPTGETRRHGAHAAEPAATEPGASRPDGGVTPADEPEPSTAVLETVEGSDEIPA
ncbi:MAG: hypothetical protein ABWY68_00950, partial [Cryobacterium sp.]